MSEADDSTASPGDSKEKDEVCDSPERDEPVEAITSQTHKDILEQVHATYKREPDCLADIAALCNTKIKYPREKISVLIIGNHSAGKSSFINWYMAQYIQKESVAMETSGFVLVTSGKKRDTFKGAATMRHFPFLEGIDAFEGVEKNLSTEVCDSTARNFNYVDFIDTPGLTDANLKYPFDVNNIIVWLAERVDLVFVFLDPHGQATCERTMSIVRQLTIKCKDKVHYYLTKADEITNEQERSKVMVQLSQSLSRAIADVKQNYYGEHALEVKTIYRPRHRQLEIGQRIPEYLEALVRPHRRKKSAMHDFNQIYDVLDLIDQTVKENVQKHCVALQDDVKKLTVSVDDAIRIQNENVATNKRNVLTARVMSVTAWLLPALLLLYILRFAEAMLPRSVRSSNYTAPFLSLIRVFSSAAMLLDATDRRYQLLLVLLVVFFLLLALSEFFRSRPRPVRSADEMKALHRYKERLHTLGKKHGLVDELWEKFIGDSVPKSALA